ncbi:MAG: haloacid dehalogenase [Anaerolineae bacterium]|nr:MAG: haloacid dehalogenase [Anaerolineae bacterium]
MIGSLGEVEMLRMRQIYIAWQRASFTCYNSHTCADSDFASMFEIVAFDADDTLWHNESRYQAAKQAFVRLMSAFQPPEKAAAVFDQIELGNLSLYGYGMKSFTLSMIEAALALCEGQLGGREIRAILDLGRQVLTAEVELFPHVAETIAQLAAVYPLMLITKGDASEQEQKIHRSGIGHHFRIIEIVHDKTTATYQRILAKYNLSPHRFVMIGNSLRSDILPVVRIGGIAIYLPHELTWAHELEHDGELVEGSYYQLDRFEQLPSFLSYLQETLPITSPSTAKHSG